MKSGKERMRPRRRTVEITEMERKTETEKGRDADGINEYTVQCAVCENNLEEDKDEVNTFTVQYF